MKKTRPSAPSSPSFSVIGISSYDREGDPEMFPIPAGYVDAVRGAGALPVILPSGEPSPERFLDVVDGLIISGGGDLSPELYGGTWHETVYQVSENRDRFELQLTRAALQRDDVALLFICRGIQVLNVACGGTLHVHVPDRFGDQVEHRLPPRLPARHAVRIDSDSRLAEILGETRVEVCSWHHQAIDRLGDGLRAVAWADDGVVEAVEYAEHNWCIGTQWHPEMQLDEAHPAKLFRAFVEATRRIHDT
jgi:putative glutamine amidotransferase